MVASHVALGDEFEDFGDDYELDEAQVEAIIETVVAEFNSTTSHPVVVLKSGDSFDSLLENIDLENDDDFDLINVREI